VDRAEKGSHPELVEGSVRLPFIFTEGELILRQAQDDRFLKEPFFSKLRDQGLFYSRSMS
jgi:hypothetical protein